MTEHRPTPAEGPDENGIGPVHPSTPDGYFNHPEGYGNVEFIVDGKAVDREEWLEHIEAKAARARRLGISTKSKTWNYDTPDGNPVELPDDDPYREPGTAP